MRSTWTDSRLDDFKERVDSQFDELNSRVGRASAATDRFPAAHDRSSTAAFIAAVRRHVTGFSAIVGLIATQL